MTGTQGLTDDAGNFWHINTSGTANFMGHQEVSSENHPGFRNPGGGDVGGPFFNRKTEVGISSSSGKFGFGVHAYEGDLGLAGTYPTDGSFGSFPVGASNDSLDRIFALGGTAISRSIPTNPVGGAATFLGELREGFPSLIGSSLLKDRTKEALKAQKAGHEYLNVEFGWKPLVADLRKFATGVKNHDKIVRQLSRDSGRNVRRSYKFPDADTEASSTVYHYDYLLGTNFGYTLPSEIYMGQGTLSQSISKVKKTWFSGCYTYHLPDYNEVFGVTRYLAEADKLLGVKLTPEVVWNLAPWSWAADWFANTGDVMNNLTQFSQNDLALRYGYIMQTVRSRVLNAASQPIWERFVGPTMHYCNVEYTATAQMRVPASPFGFGFTFEDFSPRQLAIASALGISRVR